MVSYDGMDGDDGRGDRNDEGSNLHAANHHVFCLAIIITGISSEKLEIWTREESRVEIPLKNIVLGGTALNATNYRQRLLPGNYVMIRRLESDKDNQLYCVDLPEDTEGLAPITYDGKTISLPVNFMPIGQFLYPTTAREKNLRMAFTTNLGNIPIVFKNDYQPYHFYSGQAQIILSPTPVEQRLEATYRTPWLIVKDFHHLTSDLVIQKEMKRLIVRGTVVSIFQRNYIRAFSDVIGELTIINIQNGTVSAPFIVGDLIDFVNFTVEEDGGRRNIGVLPRKVELNSSSSPSPKFEADNLVTQATIPQDPCPSRKLVETLSVSATGIVFEKRDGDYVLAYSSDPTFQSHSSTVRINTEEVSELPDIGDHISIRLKRLSTGGPSKRMSASPRLYVIESLTVLQRDYGVRFVDGNVHIRVNASVVNEHELFSNKLFSTVEDSYRILGLSSELNRRNVQIWVRHIKHRRDAFWGVAPNPEPSWETERKHTPMKPDNDDAPEAQLSMEKGVAVKQSYCYVGPKYRRKREQLTAEEEKRKRREVENGERKMNGGDDRSATSELASGRRGSTTVMSTIYGKTIAPSVSTNRSDTVLLPNNGVFATITAPDVRELLDAANYNLERIDATLFCAQMSPIANPVLTEERIPEPLIRSGTAPPQPTRQVIAADNLSTVAENLSQNGNNGGRLTPLPGSSASTVDRACHNGLPATAQTSTQKNRTGGGTFKGYDPYFDTSNVRSVSTHQSNLLLQLPREYQRPTHKSQQEQNYNGGNDDYGHSRRSYSDDNGAYQKRLQQTRQILKEEHREQLNRIPSLISLLNIQPPFITEIEQLPEPDASTYARLFPQDGVVVSVCADGFFVYTRDNPEREAFLSNERVLVGGHHIRHGDWLNLEAKFVNYKYVVTNFVWRPPMLATQPIRNSIMLRLTGFVPQNYNGSDPVGAMIISKFISEIGDIRRLVVRSMLAKHLVVEVVRRKPVKISPYGWQLQRIIRVKEDNEPPSDDDEK